MVTRMNKEKQIAFTPVFDIYGIILVAVLSLTVLNLNAHII